MADLVTARLGPVEFSLKKGPFTDIDRTTSWRVDVPEPLEGLGVPVVRGRERDEITFNGLVFPGWVGELESVQRLRDAGDAGKPLLLTDGEGQLYGEWVVKSVTERQSAHTPTGIARRREWSLTLVAVPDDGDFI